MKVSNRLYQAALVSQICLMVQWHAHYLKAGVTLWDTVPNIFVASFVIYAVYNPEEKP